MQNNSHSTETLSVEKIYNSEIAVVCLMWVISLIFGYLLYSNLFSVFISGESMSTSKFYAVIMSSTILLTEVIAAYMSDDAAKRGQDPLEWFLKGMILSIFGLVIWIRNRPPVIRPQIYEEIKKFIEQKHKASLSNKKSNNNSQKQILQQINKYTGISKVCINCGRVVPLDSIVCPYCGYNFKIEKQEA